MGDRDTSPFDVAVTEFREAKAEFDAAARRVDYSDEPAARKAEILRLRANPAECARRTRETIDRKAAQFTKLKDSRPESDASALELLSGFAVAQLEGRDADFLKEKALDIETAWQGVVGNMQICVKEIRLMTGIASAMTLAEAAVGRGKALQQAVDFRMDMAQTGAHEEHMFNMLSRMGHQLRPLRDAARAHLPAGYQSAPVTKKSEFGGN